MKNFFAKIVCFFSTHQFENKGEERETGTWAPYPAMGELFQPQQCKRCKVWQEVWTGFTWDDEKEEK